MEPKTKIVSIIPRYNGEELKAIRMNGESSARIQEWLFAMGLLVTVRTPLPGIEVWDVIDTPPAA